jgi:hypothetical protein
MSIPTPGDKVIDSRDIIARLEELQDERNDIQERVEEAEEEAERIEAIEALEEWDFENEDELKRLKELSDECDGYGDWHYGETLIRREYWVEYCQQLLEDIGVLPKDLPTYIEIDWDKTADNLEADYASVNFGDDEEYLIRNC